MQTIASLSDFWQTFFIEPSAIRNCDVWVIVYMARDHERLFISIANPFTDEQVEAFIAVVSETDVRTFITHYRQRFLTQLPVRFGLFRPEIDHVLTEYPNWQTFYDAWIHDNPLLLQANLPILFDYPTASEYRAMQLKNSDYAGYRRLLVIIYQYRKQKFQKVFIKDVDDVSFLRITQQMSALYHQYLPQLILK